MIITCYAKRILFIFSIIFIPISYGRTIITGDAVLRDGRTFSFPIHAYYANQTNRLYVGAANPGAKDFAVSYLNKGESIFRAYAPEKIQIDKIAEQKSPLYNAAIAQLAEIDAHNLALTLQEDPFALYLINFSTSSGELFSIPSLCDAAGAPSNGIIALTGAKSTAFIAVKGNGQAHFGDGASGIALAAFHEETKEQEVSEKELEELQEKLQDASDEEKQQAVNSISTNKDGKKIKKVIVKTFGQISSAAVSKTSPFLKIGNDLVAIDDTIALHWSTSLERVYVGVKACGGDHETDGVRAIAVGRIEGGKLVLSPIVGDTFLNDTYNQIIGSKGSNAQVAIHTLATLQTTTGFLDYLIVHGGNGTADETQRMVYAFPLLNLKDTKGIIDANHAHLHGTLAHVQRSTYEAFRDGRSHIFLGRHFVEPPQKPSDIFTKDDSAARVGAGPLDAGPIANIFVKDDSVYAIVTNPDPRYQSGVYYSQAIFDGNGSIAAWTHWQKIVDSEESLYGVLLDSAHANTVILSGSFDDGIRTVERTGWQLRSSLNPLFACINDQFIPEDGGIQELAEFSFMYSDMEGAGSILCATGLSKVVLAHLLPEFSNTAPICLHFNQGAIDTPLARHAQVLVFTGGDIEKLGPIASAQLACVYGNELVFVGGAYGLAVLCDERDKGSDATYGFDCGFKGLRPGMAFREIGDYQYVRKLIADEQFLYVLTDRYLDRIDLSASHFCSGQLQATRLANVSELTQAPYSLFYDMIVSEKFALLAHTHGLHRVGNNHDIRTDNFQTLKWTNVSVAKPNTPVIALVPVTVTGQSNDSARYAAGQLYAISGRIGTDSASLNRFVIHNVINKQVDDYIIFPVPDFITEEKSYNYFANLGAYSSLFATDGTIFYTGTDRKKLKPPMLWSGFGRSKSHIPLAIDDAANITRILRSRTTGNWIIAGDFGLLVND